VLDAMKGDLYRSKDGGLSFTKSEATLPKRGDFQLITSCVRTVPGHEGHVWISAGYALKRSTDGGETLVKILGIDEGYAIGFGKPAAGAKYPAIYFSGKIGGKKSVDRSDEEGEYARYATARAHPSVRASRLQEHSSRVELRKRLPGRFLSPIGC
jgi:hypothetical protein